MSSFDIPGHNATVSTQASTSAVADPSNALPLNAVASISLALSGPKVSLVVFPRIEGVENEPLIHESTSSRKDCGSEPPARLPSSLPPPGDLHLRVQLGKRIGHGRSGVVYDATISLDDSSPEVASYVLPPLVAKISRHHHCEELEHEVYYYDELESLQGVVVPRCYGLFQTRVPNGFSIIPPEQCKADQSTTDLIAIPLDPPPKKISGIVSILLLERLGGHLPVGKPLPEGTYEEIMAMYSDLAQLGVDHCDIRWSNILYAPQSPHCFPSLPSPYTGRAYRWRLVDFNNSEKTNQGLVQFYDYHECYVERLLQLLPTGYVVEPWE